MMADGKIAGAGNIATDVGCEPTDRRLGAVVDKYTVVRVLGRGGMGTVYEVRHAALARRFAIKFLLPEFAANRDVLRRFENEAKAAGGLEHPNLAAVTDFGRATDGSPYLVMEFLEGQDCAKLLRQLGPLPFPRAANIVQQACRGLAVAHRAAIVHRDLKPENLFVTDAGDGSDLVKVLDFGIAKLRPSEASVVTGTGATFGTAFYMSPEQARGAGEVDGRADVWSLGVLLYELLSGRRPFEGEQFLNIIHQILSVEPPLLATLRSDVPPELVAVVERAMTKDLSQRLPSVAALGEALAPFANRERAVQPVRAAQATAPTVPTPATGIALVAGGARSGTGQPGSSSPVPAIPPVAWQARARPMLGLALLVIVAVVVALWALRRPVEPTESRAGRVGSATAEAWSAPSESNRIEAAHSPPPTPPTSMAPGQATASTLSAAASALPRSPISQPQTTESAPPVRSMSDHGSNRRTVRGPIEHKPVLPSPLPPGSASKPASAKGNRAGPEPIDIQRDNPYDP